MYMSKAAHCAIHCFVFVRPVHKEDSAQEEVVYDKSSELTLNQLEDEIQVGAVEVVLYI